MKKDPDWALAGKWIARAEALEERVREYDPEEKHLPEVGEMIVEADTLRKCAIDLMAREPKVSTEEEIPF